MLYEVITASLDTGNLPDNNVNTINTPAAFDICFLLNNVITSYSIHYTKLYETLLMSSRADGITRTKIRTTVVTAITISMVLNPPCLSGGCRLTGTTSNRGILSVNWIPGFIGIYRSRFPGSVQFCWIIFWCKLCTNYEFAPKLVITSYSIHYTKLYEFLLPRHFRALSINLQENSSLGANS